MVLDLVVIGILLVSACVAFLRGFVREVLTIGSLMGAAAATYLFGPQLKPMVAGWLIDPATPDKQLFNIVPYEMLVPVVAFALVFCVTIMLLTLATHLLSRGVHAVGLGPVDRSLGVVFGLIRGVMVIGLMSLVLNFVLSDKQREQYFGDSKTYPYVTYMGDLAQAILPDRDVVEKIKGKRHEEKLAKTGKQPLEPGQVEKAKDASKTTLEEDFRETVVNKTTQKAVEQVRKKFND